MKKYSILATIAAVISAGSTASAQFSMTPMTSFQGDGWFAPGEGGYTHVTTGDLQRGMAYSAGELLVVSRNGGANIRRLNATTGSEVGFLSTSGISGGFFTVNKVAAASDGAIYVANMTTAANTGAGAFKIYKYSTTASTPTVVYSGAPISDVRIGDSTLAVSGSGASTILVSGFASTFSTNRGYAVINPTSGTSTAVGFASAPPNAGDFRLGLTIGPSGQIWGNQGSSALRETTFSGSTGTLLGTATGLISTAERPMAYNVVNGLSILATISSGDSRVRVYDASNPLALILLGSGNNTSGTLTSNGNGTGDVAFGAQTDNGNGTTTVQLYAMSSNQGIQAFNVVVPEPTTGALLGLGISALIAMRRSRK
jgi:hypothetical protein